MDLLPDAEIIRRVRVIRFSPARERNAGRLPSINRLAELAGMTRAGLYQIAQRGTVGQSSRRALTAAFNACQCTDSVGRREP
jgi:hypothetical protein